MTTANEAPGRALAEWVAALHYDDLNDETLGRVRALVLDHLGVAVLGATRPHMTHLRALEARLGGEGTSTVLGTDMRTALDRAAFLNGVAGSSGPNLDDVCHGSLGHPGVGTLPAALVMGEGAQAGGQALVEATVVGYEVAIRFGEAVGRSAFDRGWHPRGGCNAMAAAVSALKVTGHDDPATYFAAMGHAANATGGLVGASYFADSWYLLSGNAARAGLLAALTAQAGLDVPSSSLGGSCGYVLATSDVPNVAALERDLGQALRVFDAGQKLYPSSGGTHAALEATVAAREQLQCNYTDVVSIQVAGFSQLAGVLGQPFPASAVAASMSVPYVVACGLRDGTFDLRHLEDDRINDGELQRIQNRVTLCVDERLDGLPPAHLGARVTLRTSEGATATVEVLTASGHPGNPLGLERVAHKVRELLGGADRTATASDLSAVVAQLPAATPAQLLAATRPRRD